MQRKINADAIKIKIDDMKRFLLHAGILKKIKTTKSMGLAR